MRQRASRRMFIGLGLGCAAPLLISPLAKTTSVFSRPVQSGTTDPILEHLRGEMLGNYRRMRARATASGTVGGEDLRAFASQLRLLNAQMVGRGTDARLNTEVGLRVQRDGRDAAALALSDEARAAASRLALPGVRYPDGPDFARATVAVDLLQRRGIRPLVGDLSRWVEAEAARADRAAGRVLPVSVVIQKPGDDFGGYPEPDISGFNCGMLKTMIDSAWVVIAILTLLGQIPEAEIWGLVAAVAQVIVNVACT